MSECPVWSGVTLIGLDKLTFCDWNCNELGEKEMAALILDIQNGQFDEPLQVIPTEDERYLVIGGEHRAKALMALDQSTAPCIIRNDLSNLSRSDLMLWSVRRNNIRGRINEQKYASMESELVERHSMTAEAARRSMLLRDDLVKKLKSDSKDNKDSNSALKEKLKSNYDKSNFDQKEKSDPGQSSDLIKSLRQIEQKVLLESADTVEYGYLFFHQGSADQSHLIIETDQSLSEVLKKVVEYCKNSELDILSFFVSSLTSVLDNKVEL